MRLLILNRAASPLPIKLSAVVRISVVVTVSVQDVPLLFLIIGECTHRPYALFIIFSFFLSLYMSLLSIELVFCCFALSVFHMDVHPHRNHYCIENGIFHGIHLPSLCVISTAHDVYFVIY